MIRILMTMGDPSGVGPEVLLASLRDLKLPPAASISIIGDCAWLARLAPKLSRPIPWRKFNWIDVRNVPAGLRLGKVQAGGGRAAYEYLRKAAQILRRRQADALVTGPVCKEAIAKSGISWVGHTEFLASVFRRKAVMMFVTGSFRVSLVTTHLSVRKLPGALRRSQVVQAIRMTQESLRKDFGVRRPRIGLAALNPHGGEGGLFGDEEKKILRPALRAFGDSVEGPIPSDSLMQAAAQGRYDAVVALYHDQALIPVKLLGWEKAVNVTLGLPFVRTSPVHGTAFDLAGTGKADPSSMKSAIALAATLALHRATGR